MFQATDLRILTYGRLSEEFEQYIRAHHPKATIVRANTKEEIGQILPKFNVFAGLNHLQGLDLTSLQWIHAFGAGVDSFLAMPALTSRIILTRTLGDMGKKMGEYCLAYLLAFGRHLFEYRHQQTEHHWQQRVPETLGHKKVLILGTGYIAKGIAQALRPFCQGIIGMNRTGKAEEGFDQVFSPEDLGKNGQGVQVIINSLPYTLGTHHLVGKEFFTPFHDALFINIGRGATVDSAALLEAIQQGHIQKAVLDVFEQEPLPVDSPLWQHDKIWVTPHVSGITAAADAIQSFEASLACLRGGQRDAHFVNLERGY
jgi:glyoxylate/hydroxypyruvate reductase